MLKIESVHLYFHVNSAKIKSPRILLHRGLSRDVFFFKMQYEDVTVLSRFVVNFMSRGLECKNKLVGSTELEFF